MTNIRIGHGFDTHRFQAEGKLMLAGIEIPFEKGITAHSDGDVVIHALCDALLGALALGDIGQHYSPNDPRWRDQASSYFLQDVIQMIASNGYKLGNCDITVLAEQPKLFPYIAAMRESLATWCKSSLSQISLKATTMEGMGFIGQQEGIAAHAVVLLVSSHD